MFYFGSSPWIIRKVTCTENKVYLTFDDGPNPEVTPKVLDALQKSGAFASFFVIGEKASAYPELIARMIEEGHSVHSHSADHRYDIYFRRKDTLKDWIAASLTALGALTGLRHRSFRPPAGVVTPPMVQVARALNVPLVLWNHRFFDTALTWTTKKAVSNAAILKPGDIVLLHDDQKSLRADLFVETLSIYIAEIQKRGFSLRPLGETGLV
ncbi:MAG: polysaccharide deacetylase family protein [Bdellovibrionaceae bacterium]|nr:polysaccharide deacetylase family protein [Pseudobdellovibrionaceae bacterium]